MMAGVTTSHEYACLVLGEMLPFSSHPSSPHSSLPLLSHTHTHTHTHAHSLSKHTHTHTHIAGTFPVVSLMVGTAVTRITSAVDYCNEEDLGSGSGFNVTMTTTIASNDSNPCTQTPCNDLRADIAVSLSLLVGILMVCLHGFITV